jgi:hypothetical protein
MIAILLGAIFLVLMWLTGTLVAGAAILGVNYLLSLIWVTIPILAYWKCCILALVLTVLNFLTKGKSLITIRSRT